MSPTVTEIILHCQKQIKKEPPEDKLLHYLGRLKRLRIHIQDLVDTGIGRTINLLSRVEGRVGEEAWRLVQQWKALVEEERTIEATNDSESGESSSNEEDDDDEDGPPNAQSPQQSASVHPHQTRPEAVTSSLPDFPSSASRVLGQDRSRSDGEEVGSDSEGSDRLCIDDKVDKVAVAQLAADRRMSTSSSSSSSSGSSSSDSEAEPGTGEPLTQKQKRKHVVDAGEVIKVSCQAPGELPYSNLVRASEYQPQKPERPEQRQVKVEPKSSSSSSSSDEESSAPPTSKSSGHKSSRHPSPAKIDVSRRHSPSKADSKRHHSSKKSGHSSPGNLKSDRHHSPSKPKSEHHHSPSKSKSDRHHTSKSDSSRHRSPAKTDSRHQHSSSKSDSIRHRSHSPAKNDSKRAEERHRDRGSSSNRKHDHRESKSSSSHSHSHKSSSSRESKEKVKDSKLEARERESILPSERDFKSEKSARVAHVKKDPEKLESLNGASNVKPESSSKVKEKDRTEEKSRKDRENEHERKESKRKADSIEEKQGSKKIKLEKDGSEKSTKDKTVSNSLKPKLLPRLNVEIDSTSGVNFADVLGGLDAKKLTKSKSGSKKSDRDSNKPKKSSIILPPQKALNGIIQPDVQISPYYKPSSSMAAYTSKASTSTGTRTAVFTEESSYKAKIQQALNESLNDSKYWEDSRLALGSESAYQSEGDALSKMITSRNQRSKVFSGAKTTGFTGKVPTLFSLCLRVIQDNIDDLGYTGGVPFEILEPALSKTTPTQLQQVENYNPYLLGSTDNLWKFHCQRDFRGKPPQELESWRELYMRSIDERNARLASLTNKFKNQQDVAVPVRKTKLAYVDTSGGPKFSKTKAATIKSGMSSLKTREEKGSKRGHGSSASSGMNNNQDNIVVEEASVIINGKSRRAAGPSASSSSNPAAQAFVAKQKPKKAPLMQKTLKSMKTLLRR